MAGRLQEIFEQVVALRREERDPYLKGACGTDQSLRAEVETLLRAHDQAADFLSSPTGNVPVSAPTLAALLREGPGTKIGPYKLLQQIGEGGFGVVFLAEQEKPVARRVALKIIKLGMDTHQVVARFEQERQALAMMDHPNIARVFDAGATETGRPYFVMELVKGDPITEYCDKQNLSVEERLRLFEEVCHAVQHAHQKGIIHRDIKPSNVLVTVADGKPIPKVIDFGIAKATLSKLTEKTLFTEHRALIGTPEYMSPEQAEMSGVDIDTRSDIYSLGVLLYELLTGALPFDPVRLRSAAFGEIQRIIREEEPPNPSTRLSTLGTLASVAAHRHTEPARLARLIRGDLDWIVMKALEKDRTRRYETANGLAADVERHLAGEPVLAAPPSVSYRVHKFVRRHKVGVAAGLAIAGALVLGVIGTTAGFLNARAQREKADTAREVAEAARVAEAQQRRLAQSNEQKALDEARRAEQEKEAAQAARSRAEFIAEFMSQMLEGAGPSVARGRDTTMLKEMMDGAAARIEKGDLKSAPEAELRLRATIGNTYRELAAFDAAARLLEPAVALARSLYPGDHPDVATSLTNLASLLRDRADLAGAETLFRESLEMRRRLFPGDHPAVAADLNILANLLRERGDLAGAETLSRESLEMSRRLFPGDHADVAAALNTLGALLLSRGDLAGAEPLFREAVNMLRRLFPGDHPAVANVLNNLALLLKIRADLAGAEPLYREVLDMTRRLFPGDHPAVAVALNNLAVLLKTRGDLAGAEPFTREAVDVWRRLFPGDHPGLAASLTNLAGLLLARGDLAGAEPLLREAVDMQKRLFPGDHPDVADGLSNLAYVLQNRGDLAGAEPLYRESLEMSRRLYPGDHPGLAAGLNNLATLLGVLGDLAGAETLARESLEMSRRLYPGDHPDVAFGLNTLAGLLLARGDLVGAGPLYHESLEMTRRLYPGDHPDVAFGLKTLALLHQARGELTDAESLFAQALEMNRRLFPGDHPEVAGSLSALASCLDAIGRSPDAVPYYREALAMQRRLLPTGSPQLAGPMAQLGLTLLKTGTTQAALEAEPVLRECLEMRRTAYPDGHPEVYRRFNTMSQLGEAILGVSQDTKLASSIRIEKIREAESLLLDGYAGFKDDPAVPKPDSRAAAGNDYKRQALQRIVKLYETWDTIEPGKGYQDRAAEWRKKLENGP